MSRLDPKHVGEVFWVFFFNDLTDSQKWKLRCSVCWCMTTKFVLWSLDLPHNKRGVSHGETDKHLDKLNKAFTRSFWDCVFIFVSSKLYVQGSWFVCLGFCRRFVELVKKTNYILTFLHVFVFVPPAGCGVQIFADKAFCPVAPIPAPTPWIYSQLVNLSFWEMKILCVYFLSHASQVTNKEEPCTLKETKSSFISGRFLILTLQNWVSC